MGDKRKDKPETGQGGQQDARKARLSEALRANLKRRRAQARARRAADPPPPRDDAEEGDER